MENTQKQKMSVELSSEKIQRFSKFPAIHTSVRKSADGKWLVYKTTTIDLKPVSYFEKVLRN